MENVDVLYKISSYLSIDDQLSLVKCNKYYHNEVSKHIIERVHRFDKFIQDKQINYIDDLPGKNLMNIKILKFIYSSNNDTYITGVGYSLYLLELCACFNFKIHYMYDAIVNQNNRIRYTCIMLIKQENYDMLLN